MQRHSLLYKKLQRLAWVLRNSVLYVGHVAPSSTTPPPAAKRKSMRGWIVVAVYKGISLIPVLSNQLFRKL